MPRFHHGAPVAVRAPEKGQAMSAGMFSIRLALISILCMLGSVLASPAAAASLGSDPEELTRVGNTLFFSAQGPGGRELWKSDGTEAGTVRVKDIRPGSGSSNPTDLTDVDGTLFFTAFDGTDSGLWTSDGTEDGTQLVKTVRGYEFTAVGDKLFFATDNQLWVSDGTDVGTEVIRTFGGNRYIGELEAVGDRLFVAVLQNNTDQLWESDGSPEGTRLVEKVDHVEQATGIWTMTAVGDRLYFLRETEFGFDCGCTFPSDLWTSDGTSAGTHRVKDLRTGHDDVGNLVGSSGTLLFQEGFNNLWRTDGTKSGTTKIKHFDGLGSVPMTNVAGKVFLVADGALWKSNGTPNGTKLVDDATPFQQERCGPFEPCHRVFRNFDPIASHGLLYFPSEAGGDGVELWRSDGTANGTNEISDIHPGTEGSRPADLTRVGDVVFFSANDGVHGRELWVTDGTDLGTMLVRNI